MLSVSSGRSASLVDNEDAAGCEAEFHKCLSHLFAAEYLPRERYADLPLDPGGGRLLPDPVEDALERVLALSGGDDRVSRGETDLQARLLLCSCGRGGRRVARGRLWARRGRARRLGGEGSAVPQRLLLCSLVGALLLVGLDLRLDLCPRSGIVQLLCEPLFATHACGVSVARADTGLLDAPFFFCSAALRASLSFISSLMAPRSLSALRRMASFFFASSASLFAAAAFRAAAFSRSSASFSFFSCSVSGRFSSVDSSKLLCPLFSPW